MAIEPCPLCSCAHSKGAWQVAALRQARAWGSILCFTDEVPKARRQGDSATQRLEAQKPCAGAGKAAEQQRKRTELAAALAVYAARARLAAAAAPGRRSAPMQEDDQPGAACKDSLCCALCR
jgi:hypothetical protein